MVLRNPNHADSLAIETRDLAKQKAVLKLHRKKKGRRKWPQLSRTPRRLTRKFLAGVVDAKEALASLKKKLIRKPLEKITLNSLNSRRSLGTITDPQEKTNQTTSTKTPLKAKPIRLIEVDVEVTHAEPSKIRATGGAISTAITEMPTSPRKVMSLSPVVVAKKEVEAAVVKAEEEGEVVETEEEKTPRPRKRRSD